MKRRWQYSLADLVALMALCGGVAAFVTREEPRTIPGPVRILDMTADGSALITLRGRLVGASPMHSLQWLHDTTVSVWDVERGRQLPLDSRFPILQAKFSDDGRYVVSCALIREEDGKEQGILAVWDAWSGDLVRELHDSEGWIVDAVMTPGKRVVYGTGDGRVCKLVLSSGEKLWEREFEGEVSSIDWNAAAGRLSVAHDADASFRQLKSHVRMLDLATGETTAELEDLPYWVRSAATSRSGRYVALEGWSTPSKFAEIWEVPNRGMKFRARTRDGLIVWPKSGFAGTPSRVAFVHHDRMAVFTTATEAVVARLHDNGEWQQLYWADRDFPCFSANSPVIEIEEDGRRLHLAYTEPGETEEVIVCRDYEINRLREIVPAGEARKFREAYLVPNPEIVVRRWVLGVLGVVLAAFFVWRVTSVWRGRRRRRQDVGQAEPAAVEAE